VGAANHVVVQNKRGSVVKEWWEHVAIGAVFDLMAKRTRVATANGLHFSHHCGFTTHTVEAFVARPNPFSVRTSHLHPDKPEASSMVNVILTVGYSRSIFFNILQNVMVPTSYRDFGVAYPHFLVFFGQLVPLFYCFAH